jgi:uncharacterized membrane protein
MRRSLAVPIYVLLVFLSGALVGSVGYRLYNAKASAASIAPQHRLTPEEWRKRRIDEMRTRLKLSDEQVVKLQGVYDEVKQMVGAFDLRSKAELKAIHDKQTQMIRALLTEPQRVEYDKLRQEREEKARQKHQAEEKKNHPGS